MRDRASWAQLLRFGVVGASGYVVNLLVFAAALDGAGFSHRIAAVFAFVVALCNNFYWNRHWTFRAGHGHAGFQAARFTVVALFAFLVSLGILEFLVVVDDLDPVLSQAVAIGCATPLNVAGHRLWSFRR